ncbi:MAG: hypothetical protein ALECFALPRED_001243 [Alectoria fallacina]|uniref:Uncharacterized protein n=1 Tax=Alectoria fallacina TaxID=1903189 RepID=A0A8H3FCR2_9LECA|nr:MAG: hypothetical protein ALECFALPRED_001243 [Alectoria fallacina]
MSQWNRLCSGPKRKSDFTDPERPGSYHFPLPQQSHTSQSSEASTSPHGSQEGQIPKALGQLASLTVQNGISFDVVGTRINASFHASSSKTRLLTPPPTSSGTFTLPPIALSSPRPTSCALYSGNLPHRLGTDYPTTHTPTHENIDLASAYAQAQLYIADLDTRVQASRAENGKLAKERKRLRGKIELLETQLETLEQSKQQTQEHTTAKDAQYLRIVELSTRLQIQCAEESQARRVEQHEWYFEKKSMQSVIDSLENAMKGLRKAYARHAKSPNLMSSPIDNYLDIIEGSTDSVAESSSHELIAEIEALRRTNAKMKDALIGVRGDNAHLAEYIEKLGSVEKNIQIRLQKVENARDTMDVFDEEEATAKE